MFNEIIKYVESSIIVQIKKNQRQFVLKKKKTEKKIKLSSLSLNSLFLFNFTQK